MTITAMPTTETDEVAPKRSRKRLIIVLVIVVAVLAAAAYLFVLKPKGSNAPRPGTVLALDEQTVNLAGGHYLKIQASLQLTTKAAADLDGSKAENDIIDLFSGQEVGDLDTGTTRERLQEQLKNELIKDYDNQVMDVYLTEFVTT